MYCKFYFNCLWICFGCCGIIVKIVDIIYNGSCIGIFFNIDLYFILKKCFIRNKLLYKSVYYILDFIEFKCYDVSSIYMFMWEICM